jgi:hypothetical protein
MSLSIENNGNQLTEQNKMENMAHTNLNMQSFIAAFYRIKIDTELTLEIFTLFIFRADIKGGHSSR